MRGGSPEPLRVRSTSRGPLITGIEQDWIDGDASIGWFGGHPAATIDALLGPNAAISVDDALAIRDLLVAPTLMMVEADSAGSIPVGGDRTTVRNRWWTFDALRDRPRRPGDELDDEHAWVAQQPAPLALSRSACRPVPWPTTPGLEGGRPGEGRRPA